MVRTQPSLLVAALALTLLQGCVAGPRTTERKEVFVEPFREADYELGRLKRVVPFPLAPSDQPRAYACARPFAGDDERLPRVRSLMAADESSASHEDELPDPTKEDRPPTSLVLPDRIDVRDTSACYLGHDAFLDRAQRGVIHHLRLLIVNREKTDVSVPIASFALVTEESDRMDKAVSLPLLVAATDRGIKVTETVDVARGEQRLVHFFYAQGIAISPILSVRWTASVDDGRGGPPREVEFRSELVRRYVVDGAPLSPLEDRVARGLLDLPTAQGTRSDWIDPGLTSVPGSGK